MILYRNQYANSIFNPTLTRLKRKVTNINFNPCTAPVTRDRHLFFYYIYNQFNITVNSQIVKLSNKQQIYDLETIFIIEHQKYLNYKGHIQLLVT